MVAVITGDIIHSQKANSRRWNKALKDVVDDDFKKTQNFEIYRGDEFQYFMEDAKDAFRRAFLLKARMRMLEDLDVRLSIGLGERTTAAKKVSQSNGSAFVNSGRCFDQLKTEGINLKIKSNNLEWDSEMNLLLEWFLETADNWTKISAEIMFLFLKEPDLSQEEAAKRLQISQSSVSQRLNRAKYQLVLKTEQYFRQKIESFVE